MTETNGVMRLLHEKSATSSSIVVYLEIIIYVICGAHICAECVKLATVKEIIDWYVSYIHVRLLSGIHTSLEKWPLLSLAIINRDEGDKCVKY